MNNFNDINYCFNNKTNEIGLSLTGLIIMLLDDNQLTNDFNKKFKLFLRAKNNYDSIHIQTEFMIYYLFKLSPFKENYRINYVVFRNNIVGYSFLSYDGMYNEICTLDLLCSINNANIKRIFKDENSRSIGYILLDVLFTNHPLEDYIIVIHPDSFHEVDLLFYYTTYKKQTYPEGMFTEEVAKELYENDNVTNEWYLQFKNSHKNLIYANFFKFLNEPDEETRKNYIDDIKVLFKNFDNVLGNMNENVFSMENEMENEMDNTEFNDVYMDDDDVTGGKRKRKRKTKMKNNIRKRRKTKKNKKINKK
jgi:hypothetical protein